MNNKKNTRMCVICRERMDKKNLIRIVSNLNNKIEIDTLQKQNTRGLYICPKKECIEKLLKQKNIDRMFKVSLNNPDVNQEFINEVLEKLKRG